MGFSVLFSTFSTFFYIRKKKKKNNTVVSVVSSYHATIYARNDQKHHDNMLVSVLCHSPTLSHVILYFLYFLYFFLYQKEKKKKQHHRLCRLMLWTMLPKNGQEHHRNMVVRVSCRSSCYSPLSLVLLYVKEKYHTIVCHAVDHTP